MSAIATMPIIAAEEFTYTFDQVAATQDSMIDRIDAKFALVTIPIELVRINETTPVMMTDEEIEENEDAEYMDDLIEAVREAGEDPFPPSVVIQRGDHYEWIDGQHRMTALYRAGFTETKAFVAVF